MEPYTASAEAGGIVCSPRSDSTRIQNEGRTEALSSETHRPTRAARLGRYRGVKGYRGVCGLFRDEQFIRYIFRINQRTMGTYFRLRLKVESGASGLQFKSPFT